MRTPIKPQKSLFIVTPIQFKKHSAAMKDARVEGSHIRRAAGTHYGTLPFLSTRGKKRGEFDLYRPHEKT
jgi:hypothetical protein